MFRLLTVATLISTLALGAGAGGVLGRGPSVDGSLLSVPSHADTDSSFVVQLRLPARAAAVDGRLFFDTSAAEVIGVAPAGKGTGMAPVEIDGGVAFGAYGLRSTGGSTVLNIVVAPSAAGQLQFRVVVDATADAAGTRFTLTRSAASGVIGMGASSRLLGAPRDTAQRVPVRASTGTRDLVRDGRVGVTDIDVVRAAWEESQADGAACAAFDPADDANGDGCVDIVDIQALVAAQGWRTVGGRAVDPRQAPAGALDDTTATAETPRAPTLAAAGLTFVVNSTANSGDANNGDGLCADSQGRCTLRAAITEANWQSGENRIEFNLPGTAPVLIQLADPRLTIQDRTGGVVIDGYSQPGSSVNTATVGSNAVPGVELRGTAGSPRSSGLRITSANNTIRGILFNGHYRGINIDGVDAHHNLIAGNLMGFSRTGSPDSYRGHDNIYLQGGAHHNQIGAPSLADRNVAGRQQKSLYLYGPGTDYNVLQNNFLCMTPSGMATASCSTAVDVDFGPKRNLFGGTGALEKNVMGATTLNGLEISHGWNPNGPDTNDKWHNDYNSVIGNWIGFRGDGSYNASFLAGLNTPNNNDGNAVNVYDGSNYNLIEGNWIGGRWDGVNTMSPNSTGNIIRNNVIGESPLGQPAPLGRHGINVRNNTKTGFIEGNTIRNAAGHGIGLTQSDVVWFRLSRNIITDMSGTPIYLQPNSNGSNGANNLQPSPVITSATTVNVRGTGTAGATVEVYRASRAAGQRGLPVAYLGSGVVGTNGQWNVPVILQTGERATALQIHPSGNTSALGINVTAIFEQAPQAPVANFSWAQLAGGQTVAFTDTSTGSPATWAWEFGDATTSNQQSPNHAYTATGDYTVKLTVSNAGGPSSVTKTVTVTSVSQVFLAADAFAGSASNGWGTADIGGAYTITGTAANYSVAAGVGNMVVPTAGLTRSAMLNSVSEDDVDIRFRVAVDKVATGGALRIFAVARRNTNNEYRPQLVFNTNGTVSAHAGVVVGGTETALGAAVVVPGVTQAPGAFVWVRAQVTGSNPTTIRIKAWADGQSEPANWLYTATNSAAAVQGAGSLGVRAYVGSATSNSPITFRFDDYAVTAGP